MFDCHAHYGKPSEKALLCSPSPEESVELSSFPFRSFGLIPEGGCKNLEKLEERIQDHSFVGEIGIDKRYPDIEDQIRLFRGALDIAKRYDTLATIHYVGYTDVLLSILKDSKPHHFIVHGFTGSLDTALAIEHLGGLISLSPRSKTTKSFEKLIHNTSFLIETDMRTGTEQEETLSSWGLELSRMLDRDIGKEAEERFFSYLGGIKVPTFKNL